MKKIRIENSSTTPRVLNRAHTDVFSSIKESFGEGHDKRITPHLI